MAQVFVTGGSGFIGQRLVRRLLDEGHTVRALVRSDASAEKMTALGVEPVQGDLNDGSTWDHGVVGSDVFFHLAAETDVSADHARHQLVTVEGTRTAVEVARRAGVATFVLCGSEAGLLAGDPLVDVDETAPLRPDSAAAYCAAKAASEQIVLAAAAPGFATVSVRPRMVWGPQGVLIDAFVAAANAGQFVWIGGGHQITDVTQVANAVEGLILGWQRGRAGEAYFVTDRHRVEFREFWTRVFEIYGVDAASIPEVDEETAEREIPVPDRWFLGLTTTLRTDKAVAELGYRPVVEYEAGFDLLREWVAKDAG